MSEGRGGGWLRYGCFGCLGVLAVLGVGIGVLLSLGRAAVERQDIKTENVEEALPAPAAAGHGTEGASDAPSGEDAPPLAVPDFDPGADAGKPPPGRVLLDLRQGEFRVEPAPAGSPLRVEAEYDQNRYELVTSLDEDADGWSYEILFRQTRSGGLVGVLARIMGAKSPRVTVYLPRDVPMDLDLRFSQGGGRADLGGLWLTDTRVAFAQGGGELEFSEPLREPTESLEIDTSMGGGAFRRLGNASPRTLEVRTQMGGGEVDLRGEWRRDADIKISSQMGGMAVNLPDGVITEGLPRDRTAPEGVDPSGLPVLRFEYSSQMGELQFR